MNRRRVRPGRLPAPPLGERDIVDRWVLSHLASAVAEVTAAFEAHDYMQAHQAASRMFWSVYCDRYIEMIKDRLGADAISAPSGRCGSPSGCCSGCSRRSRRSSPSTCTSGSTAPHEDAVSLHLTSWPAVDPRLGVRPSAVDQLAVILDATRVLRSGLRLGNSARLSQLVVQAHDEAAGRCSIRSPSRSGSRPGPTRWSAARPSTRAACPGSPSASCCERGRGAPLRARPSRRRRRYRPNPSG